MRMLRFALLLLIAAVSHTAWGNFAEANSSYEHGDFAKAKKLYQEIVNAGAWHSNVFYNLANTEHRLGNTGLAILNYERTLLVEPGHPEAKANLRLLREQAGSQVGEPHWTWLLRNVSADFYAVIAALSCWSLLFLVAVLVMNRRRFWSGISLCLLLMTFSGVGLWSWKKESAVAIITASTGEARFAPADRSALVMRLAAGSRVRILADRGSWIYCSLPDGRLGWLPESALQPVRLGS